MASITTHCKFVLPPSNKTFHGSSLHIITPSNSYHWYNKSIFVMVQRWEKEAECEVCEIQCERWVSGFTDCKQRHSKGREVVLWLQWVWTWISNWALCLVPLILGYLTRAIRLWQASFIPLVNPSPFGLFKLSQAQELQRNLLVCVLLM